MKHLLTVWMIFSSYALSIAQSAPPPAPDFTVTTSDWVQRSLYADYLDQNKAVVLKLFFTTCPFCIEMAPLLEPLYFKWGSGQGPVEFISMSIRASDSNNDVRRYRLRVDQSFPGVGNDGGSLEAITPYTNNAYGFFASTPTFVVIAPNRTVIYDPRGASNEATIDSIHQALLRTGITQPTIPFNLKGNVITPDSQKVAQVEVKVRQNNNPGTLTDTSGQFSYASPLFAGERYTLQFSRAGDATEGISTFDIVKVQRHILGTELFTSPYQLLAADVNRSSSINILDVIQLRKMVLQVEVEFTRGQSWLFLNGDYQFADPENPFFEAYVGEAAIFPFATDRKDVEPFSVIAVKIGDVNFSAR